MAAVFKMFAAVLLVVVALSGAGVLAQNHHVVGGDRGWGPAFDASAWLSGRVFRVGDKIWFSNSGTEEPVIELQSLEELLSCNLTNPIRMYTDRVSQVALEEEGVRYFTSGNLESCKKGLKLPVPVQRAPPSVVLPLPFHPPPAVGPFAPAHDAPPFPAFLPPPAFEPPPFPGHPPPASRPPPPYSAAAHMNGRSVLLFAGLLICYVGI